MQHQLEFESVIVSARPRTKAQEALRRLALAANALDAFAAEEPARRAKKALEALPPEPVVGHAAATSWWGASDGADAGAFSGGYAVRR